MTRVLRHADALANQLQRTVNISLGSALATIGLTIPAVLIVSAVGTASGRAHIILGAVHLILFMVARRLLRPHADRTVR